MNKESHTLFNGYEQLRAPSIIVSMYVTNTHPVMDWLEHGDIMMRNQ